jgi:NTP pyrophosphatase (non-canonical NTP hydrolase)
MSAGEMLRQALHHFRFTNQQRCRDVFFDPQDWSLSDWGVALAGEVGEACNIIKKINRGDFKGEFVEKAYDSLAKERLADELADAFCYLDHVAARAGIDLGEAVVRKFNEVSNKKGSSVKL